MDYLKNKIELEEKGYSILNQLYSNEEVNEILHCIKNTQQNKESFTKTEHLFAIRQLIKNIPNLSNILFNNKIVA